MGEPITAEGLDALRAEPAIDMAMLDPVPDGGAEPPADPWLVRRGYGFGASDLAVVLAALGWRSAEDLPAYMQRRVKPKRVRGIAPTPRVWLEKAGIVAPLAVRSGPASRGSERERELVTQWTRLVAHGAAGPDAALVDAGSVVHVEGDWPREVLPLTDCESPRLKATPDVLARDVLGQLGCVDMKCSVRPYGELRWYHRVQVHAQMAVCSADWGAIVEGEGWSADWRDHAGEPVGAIVTRAFERDEELVRELRAAAAAGWARVEAARSEWEGAQ